MDGLRLSFARHGESSANLTRTFSNSDPWHPLTERGREQARALAASLASEGITALYCSPAVRAVQTATIIGGELGVSMTVAEALREYDVGRWEGTNDPAGWDEYHEVLAAWVVGDEEWRVGGGESLNQVRDRLRAFAIRLEEEHGPDERVLVIGHGGAFHLALPAVLANVTIELALENPLDHTAIVVATVKDGGLECSQWGEREL